MEYCTRFLFVERFVRREINGEMEGERIVNDSIL